MGYTISVVSLKGGVGKSTIARSIGVSYAAHDWRVKVCDLDYQQSTSYRWQQRRLEHDLQPTISVETFKTVERALSDRDYDLHIVGGAPHASSETKSAALESGLVMTPTDLPWMT